MSPLRDFLSIHRGAGTDANVSVEIHGDKAFVGATRLENSANNFERGQVRRLRFTSHHPLHSRAPCPRTCAASFKHVLSH